MLNIDDIDKVIQLLEQNGWDESQAANAHFAQQMAGQGDATGGNAGAGTGEEFKGEDGEQYRAPI